MAPDWRVATLPGDRSQHTADVMFVAFSSGDSGRRILSGGMDGAAAVWDASDGSQISRFRHGGSVRHGAFSPKDGRFVITGGKDQLVRVWSVGTGKRKGLEGLGDKLAILFKRVPADPVAVLPFGAIPDEVGFTTDGQTVFAQGVRFPARLADVLVAPGAAAAPAYHSDSRIALQLPRLFHLRRWYFTPAQDRTSDFAPVAAGRKVDDGRMDILSASEWTARWKKTDKRVELGFKPDDAKSSSLRGARYAAAVRHWNAARWHLDQASKKARSCMHSARFRLLPGSPESGARFGTGWRWNSSWQKLRGYARSQF